MIVYWLIFALFATGALFSRPNFEKRKPLGTVWIGGLVLIVIIGLRYHTGVDWGNYRLKWLAAQHSGLTEIIQKVSGDVGFSFLMWALAGLGFDYWALNLVCAAIFTIGLLAFARRLPNPWLATLVALPYLGIVIAMSATRQATAIGFLFFALVAFARRRTIAFLGWTAAAAAFHASSLVTLPLAGLSFAKNRFQGAILILVMATVIYFTLRGNFALYSGRYAGEQLQSSGAGIRLAMGAAASLIYIFMISKRVGIPEHERILWRNYAIAALIGIPLLWLVPSSTALDRTLLYLFPLQIFAFSFLPYVSKGTSPYVIVILLIIYSAAVLYVFLKFGVNAPSYIPYRMYWLNDLQQFGG